MSVLKKEIINNTTCRIVVKFTGDNEQMCFDG